MVATCLPVLGILFRGWSPESLINRFHSAISLRSMGSGNSGSKSHRTERPESKMHIAGNDPQSIDIEAYAMGKIRGNKNLE